MRRNIESFERAEQVLMARAQLFFRIWSIRIPTKLAI
jgi:hypothetical protein